MLKINHWFGGAATALVAAFSLGASAQEPPCAFTPATDTAFRRSVETFVQKNEAFTMGFEEDGCARVGQTIEILNKTLKGNYFKGARQFDFFMLTDETEEFNTFLIVRLVFDDEDALARLDQAVKEKKPRTASSEAPLMLETIFRNKDFFVLFSPPQYFNKNRETFHEIQKGMTPKSAS